MPVLHMHSSQVPQSTISSMLSGALVAGMGVELALTVLATFIDDVVDEASGAAVPCMIELMVVVLSSFIIEDVVDEASGMAVSGMVELTVIVLPKPTEEGVVDKTSCVDVPGIMELDGLVDGIEGGTPHQALSCQVLQTASVTSVKQCSLCTKHPSQVSHVTLPSAVSGELVAGIVELTSMLLSASTEDVVE